MYKKDFPIFQNDVIYLDSAASAQKPKCVIEAVAEFYTRFYSNVHRGTCALSNTATQMYENARQRVADFIGAEASEIIFTKGATESVNLLANSYTQTLQKGDEVLVCISEHHANFVPWQQACLKTGAQFKVFNILDDGRIDLEDFQKKLTANTKLVAVAGMSNVLGVLNPIDRIIQLSHQKGAEVVVDAAQSICHHPVDVKKLGCDYLVFSGHKIYAPTGIGVLYGNKISLEKIKPYQFGGDMIDRVSIDATTFAPLPARLEAGTPPIAEAIGLSRALDYITQVGWKQIGESERDLFSYLINKLKQIQEIQFIGNPDLKSGLVAFNIQGIHPNDLAMILAKQNVCVRVGHHCAMPLHTRFDLSASIRVSLGMYNTQTDVDAFIMALQKSMRFFK